MTPQERNLISAGLDTLSNLTSEVNQDSVQSKAFVEISKAALELAKGIVNAGHEDPAAMLRNMRASVNDAWQTSLSERFRQG